MNRKRHIKYVCLTGGIACGKSLTGLYLKELCPQTQLIEADEIVHNLLEEDQKIIDKIIKIFGKNIVAANGNGIDRRKLGQIVFKDYNSKKELENILHPPVMQIINKWKEDIDKKKKSLKSVMLAVAIIPLVFETSYTAGWDFIVCVGAPLSLQLERLVKARHLTRKEAMSRINSQLPIEYKMKMSDYVLINTGSKDFLKEQVAKLLTRIL